MKLIQAYLLLVFMHLTTNCFGQGVQGTIQDSNGKPIPFASVYVPEIKQGTTANMEGEFTLNLSKGDYELVFQYLGFQTQQLSITVNEVFITMNIMMQRQSYNLPEVIVTASGEDPAYYVMRKAIGMSQYYQNQVSAYTATVYLKGTAVPVKVPVLLRRQLKKDGIEEGKYIVVETVSEISYKKDEPLQTKVLSMRSSGEIDDTGPMQFVTISLYNDINGIISPLSRAAFQVYRFRLDGTFVENGRTINKISVIPKRKGQDLYSGTIYIRQGSWNIHSVDLKVEQRMFSIEVRQVYQQVKPLVWMPVSLNFDAVVEAFGGKAIIKYLVSVNDYVVELNPDIDHTFYANILAADEEEAQTIADLAATAYEKDTAAKTRPVSPLKQRMEELVERDDLNNKEMRELNRLVRMEATAKEQKPSLEVKARSTNIADSARIRPPDYWEQFRSAPLSHEERLSFNDPLPDSLDADTISKKGNPLLNELFFGTRNRWIAPNWRFEHNGLAALTSFNYNTVDGFVYEKKIKLSHDLLSRKRFVINANARYAFARKKMGGSVIAYFLYDPLHRSFLHLDAGSISTDFNHKNGVSPLINSATSLFNKQNFQKLYEKDYIRLNHQTDLSNGLVLQTAIECASRKKLENNTSFHLANFFGNQFTSNVPKAFADAEHLFTSQKAFVLEAKLSYTHRHYYRINDRRKQMLHTKYPTIHIGWKQGFDGILGSSSKYQLLEVGLKHAFDIKLVGKFNYEIEAGTFINNEKIHFSDFKHFNINPLWIESNSNRANMFRTLPFYEKSTNERYLRVHLRQEHTRILLKRLPFLANTLLKETLYVNSLLTSGNKPYIEFGYGVNQVFLLFDVEVVTGFEAGRHQYTGFRIGIPIEGQMIQFKMPVAI
jgi:hypothetical protein